jgi:RimJ/RimL family protein N-acetyltransferase
MGVGMIKPLTDKEFIMSVACHPVLWNEISEDGMNKDEWEPDLTEGWLGAYDGETLVGVFNLHALNSVTLKIHIMMLPQYRGELAYKAAHDALKWIVANVSFDKVNCEIPDIYPNVIRFAEKCGMVREGINRCSFRKSGKIHHQINLGITRSEIEALP